MLWKFRNGVQNRVFLWAFVRYIQTIPQDVIILIFVFNSLLWNFQTYKYVDIESIRFFGWIKLEDREIQKSLSQHRRSHGVPPSRSDLVPDTLEKAIDQPDNWERRVDMTCRSVECLLYLVVMAARTVHSSPSRDSPVNASSYDTSLVTLSVPLCNRSNLVFIWALNLARRVNRVTKGGVFITDAGKNRASLEELRTKTRYRSC